MPLPASQDRPLVFSSVFQGLSQALGPRLREGPLKEKLGALGVNLERLEPAYPEEVWERAMEAIAAGLYPELPPHEQLRRLGQTSTEGMLTTTLGKAAAGLGRVIGVKRALKRLGQNFRSGANYLEVETVELGPSEVELRISVGQRFLPQFTGTSILMPHYTLGVLEAVVAALRPRAHRTRLMESRSMDHVDRFRVSWED